MRHAIALAVGRTGMRAALVAPGGAVLYEERRALARGLRPDAVVESVLRFADDLRAHGRQRFGTAAEAAGVAVPGIVTERGIAVHSTHLGRGDVPMRELLRHRLDGMPVAVEQDVRAGGLAEGRLGAGRGAGRFLLVTLGTAVDGVIGVDDGIEAGAHGHAGRIGHVVVRPDGPACGCGRRGCLEAVASATAVGRAWSAVNGDPAVDGADCARAVAAGDEAATRVWREAIDALADALITAHTVLDLRTLIIGGRLSEAGATLFTPLRAAVEERVTFQRMPAVVPAALGDRASCLGAGLLARELLTRATAP
ncbi:ROK family protein [Streptomyces sp. NPDC001930]|uniref:ROK family protein n=1 Tax=Streptomyces sp. NPDC001930 TaxID=3364625 RepID=UPI0036B305F8